MIQKHFLTCVVVHGVEHVCSLIFEKMFKLRPCIEIKIFVDTVSTDAIIFNKGSQSHNKGRVIVLITHRIVDWLVHSYSFSEFCA